MKIRTDFVSNSSSCSFIVEATENMLAKHKIFENIDIPYTFSDEVRVYIRFKYSNFKAIFDILHKYDYVDSCLYKDEKSYIEKYPDDTAYIELTFEKFLSIAVSDDFSELRKLLIEVEFMSEDYGDGPYQLARLFNFYAINGCDPDKEDSEHEFPIDEDCDFYNILNKVV